ncbi:MAG: hypothetical protein HY510_04545, partial [Acidobacteria bacterium]|nr:hypothetical protein [Acidobacteriota bacterium]
MNALSVSGAKCTRLLAALGLALLLAGPTVLLWASRTELTAPADDDSAVLAEIQRLEMQQFERLARPFGHARLDGLSPFGDRFLWPMLREGDRAGLLVTQLGHLDPEQPEALLGLLPDSLRYRANEVTRLGRGGLVPGLNYVRLSPEAIAAGRAPEAQRAVQAASRVQGYLPEGWMLTYVEPQGLGKLRQIRDLDQFQPMQPAFKIARDLGRRPLIERARATSPELLLEVFAAAGADLAQFRQDLAGINGVSAVLDFGPNGYQVRADSRAVPHIARLRETINVEENREMMNFNAKNAPTLQAGNVED